MPQGTHGSANADADADAGAVNAQQIAGTLVSVPHAPAVEISQVSGGAEQNGDPEPG